MVSGASTLSRGQRAGAPRTAATASHAITVPHLSADYWLRQEHPDDGSLLVRVRHRRRKRRRVSELPAAWGVRGCKQGRCSAPPPRAMLNAPHSRAVLGSLSAEAGLRRTMRRSACSGTQPRAEARSVGAGTRRAALLRAGRDSPLVWPRRQSSPFPTRLARPAPARACGCRAAPKSLPLR